MYYSIPLQKAIVYITKVTAKQSYSFGTKRFMSNGYDCLDALAVCWKTELCCMEGSCNSDQTFVGSGSAVWKCCLSLTQ